MYPAKHFLLLTDAQLAQLQRGLLFAAQVNRASQRMSPNLTTTPVQWRDPIVEELHELRAQLLESSTAICTPIRRQRPLASPASFLTTTKSVF